MTPLYLELFGCVFPVLHKPVRKTFKYNVIQEPWFLKMRFSSPSYMKHRSTVSKCSAVKFEVLTAGPR